MTYSEVDAAIAISPAFYIIGLADGVVRAASSTASEEGAARDIGGSDTVGTESGGTGTGTGTDKGTDTGADTGTDTGADTGTDTGTDIDIERVVEIKSRVSRVSHIPHLHDLVRVYIYVCVCVCLMYTHTNHSLTHYHPLPL